MKQLITTAAVLFSMTAFAQVGINNTSPKATLDITAKVTDGSKPEGLIIPQVAGNQIRTATTAGIYGSSQKGLIVYASSADTAPAGATVNITAPGYYYFDGTTWQKILGTSSGDATNDAWINDTTNTQVKLGTKADGTARTSGTDVVVKDDGKVGIGTSTPGSLLDLVADNKGTGGQDDISLSSYNSTGSPSPGLIFRVARGTAAAPANLQNGDELSNIMASGRIGGNTITTSSIITRYKGDGTTNLSNITFNTSGTNRLLIDENGRVGIGTAAPKSFLHSTTGTGGVVDAGIFSIDNCGASCGQSTARNIVLNNLNGTNGLFASIDFVPSLDPTAASGASIQGIDRDATNNYAGLVFYTRNTNNYASRMILKSSGRVGIGTSAESPQATLDVKAISSGTSPEGIIAPRLSLTALQGYTYDTNQTGAIVYVNSVASGTPTGQTANVTATGYYFFDGTNWQKVASGNTLGTSLASGNIYVGNASGTAAAVTPSGDVTISNTGVTSIGTGKVTSTHIADGTVANADLNSGVGGIYKGNGSLSGNTTVTQGSNTLTFSPTVANGFSIDNSTLSVDGANHRVGIGTTTPNSMLHVSGSSGDHIRITNTGSDWALGSENAGGQNGIPGQSSFNITNRTGNFRAMTVGSDNSFRLGGNIAAGNAALSIDGATNKVGIGINVPNATLDVKAAGNGSTPEGIIAPRLSLTALQGYTYGTNQTGAIVYVNSIAPATPTGQTANVTAAGYYFFDGTNWQKVASGNTLGTSLASGNIYVGNASGTAAAVTPSGDVTISNTGVTSIGSGKVTSSHIADGTVANVDLASGTGGIYKGDGSLSGNTSVTQGTNTLTFSPTVANGFSVDTSTLSVDGANHRVGIGTTSPQRILHVNANNNSIRLENLPSLPTGRSSTGLVVDTNGDVYQNNTISTEGQILRLGLNPVTYTTSEVGLRFNLHDDASDMGSAPNGSANFINTITGATINENVTAGAGSGSPSRTTDQILLQPGVYKIQARIAGNFAGQNSSNALFVKAVVNNNEYSFLSFSNSSSTGDVYYFEDFINITGTSQTVDFTVSTAANNFALNSRSAVGSSQSYRSLIMIQRLR